MSVYYLPIWFQAVKGISPVQSGIHILPMLISMVISTISTGQLVSRIGYYTPFLIFGICLSAIGSGLFTTFQVDTSVGFWIGFQILYGFGLGASTQAPNMAAQTVLPREDVSIGASLMIFSQQLFGAIFTSVGQNVLDNQLAHRFAKIPGISPEVANPKNIEKTGITDLLGDVSPAQRPTALRAYNNSLRVDFQVATIVACLSILGALTMEWRSVKNKKSAMKKSENESTEAAGRTENNMVEKGSSNAERPPSPSFNSTIAAEEEGIGEEMKENA
jgi:MFS family permease